MCFIGGANLDILLKCPTEKNGFIATGIGIINVVLFSIVTMSLILGDIMSRIMPVPIIISLFYGFIIFIGYWGILSVIRKTIKYSSVIKLFSFVATLLISFVSSYAIEKFVLKVNLFFKLTIQQYFTFIFILLLASVVYIIPIILKLLINSSTYEEEKERIEHNFITQKEADIIAYREKYSDYALMFNDATIKMESIKQLGELSKEYHRLLENIQKETFDFINKIAKSNDSANPLLENCKSNVEEQFKNTLEKMAKIFNNI
jgi:hypothetical protein